MAYLLTAEAQRLLAMERQLRGAGLPPGGPDLASLATFKRDLQRLRTDLGAVVAWDNFVKRYRLRNPSWVGVMPHLIDEANRFSAVPERKVA